MSEERYKILNKAKKLNELANRGVGGEKENAKVMLKHYMKKHNIEISELSGHKYFESNYANMKDEDFLKEILADLFTLGLGMLFSKLSDGKIKFDRNKELNNLTDKYSNAIEERIHKHKK